MPFHGSPKWNSFTKEVITSLMSIIVLGTGYIHTYIHTYFIHLYMVKSSVRYEKTSDGDDVQVCGNFS